MLIIRKGAVLALLCLAQFVGITAPVHATTWPTNVDDTTLRRYGYVGDGNPHPLSSVPNVNGESTAGWTVTDWHQRLPAVQLSDTGLTEEIDGVVINSLILQAPSPIMFHFAPGQPRFSTPLNTCSQSVAFFGAGKDQTVLNFLASGGWDHCNGTPDPNHSVVLEAHDLTFNDNINVANTFGFNASYTSTSSKTIRFENVDFMAFNSCLLMKKVVFSIFDKVICDSKRTPAISSGNGIEIQGTSSFGIKIINSFVENYTIGYRFYSIPPSAEKGGIEGVSLTNAEAGKVKTCIEIASSLIDSTHYYTPLQYSIDRFYCDASSTFVNADAAMFLQITGGDWLFNGPMGTGPAAWKGDGQDMFRFCRAGRVIFSGNHIATNSRADPTIPNPTATDMTATVNSLIRVMGANQTCNNGAPAGSADVQIINNHIDYYNLNFNSLIINDPATKSILVKDNNFQNNYAPQIPPPAGKIVWGSPGTPVETGSALYLGNVGEVITVTNLHATATSNNEVVAGTASLPQGVWSCTGNLGYVPSPSGTTVTFTRGILTKNGALGALRGDNEVVYQDWTPIGSATSRSLRPLVFDFSQATSNSTVYLIANSTFSTGTLTVDGTGQCMRLR